MQELREIMQNDQVIGAALIAAICFMVLIAGLAGE